MKHTQIKHIQNIRKILPPINNNFLLFLDDDAPSFWQHVLLNIKQIVLNDMQYIPVGTKKSRLTF